MPVAEHGAAAGQAGNVGLSEASATERLARDGANELPGHEPRGLLRIAREVLTEPMFSLLIAAAAIYVVLGDLREAVALAASILVLVLITIVQERRTEQALARLRDLTSPRALVIRDGVERRIAGREVVTGDLIVLREGDRVPADATLRSATALSVDESILTGESIPVDKQPEQTSAGNEHSRVFSGSLVLRGFGIAEVTATGARTEIGKIGRALSTLTPETSPLHIEVRRAVRWIAIGGLALCGLVAIVYGLTRGDWLSGVLAGITLAIGVLPEEFPVVLTVFLAMGAWRISRSGVLTRRMPAIETIGSATVLAVDKTGTLTENRMRVAVIESATSMVDLRESSATLEADTIAVLATALAASELDAFDPMEHAIREAARQHAPDMERRLSGMSLIREYDLTADLLAVSHVWQTPGQTDLQVATKGAPEAVFDLCGVEPAMRAEIMQRVARYAQQGLRVLGVASGNHTGQHLPDSPRSFELRLLGLLCLADPLRADVPAALAECTRAGIRVVMVTGDHPGTALAIAGQAGFDTRAGVLTGADIEALDDVRLSERTRTVNVYARAKPEHKLRLVRMLAANGEIVAMTGDGVNDAPALKAAHIGVAMGARGTDVAREAAALVLVNDDFGSLVGAVRLGRRIYANIRHAVSYIAAVHIPIAGLGLLPVALGWPLLFHPLHVLFLEFVIDPACALVFEADPEAPDIMRRRPRPPTEPLFDAVMLRRSVLLGAGVLAYCASVYGIALSLLPEDAARALAFIGLVVSNLSLIFVSRSRSERLATLAGRRNVIYWWIAGLTLAALAIVIYLPGAAGLFRFARPPWYGVALVAAGALSCVFAVGLALRTEWARESVRA